MLSEPLEVTIRVARVLDALGVEYLVGGSLASSLHGVPRATQDVDIVAMRAWVPTALAPLGGALDPSRWYRKDAHARM
jgi:hypothetical protein